MDKYYLDVLYCQKTYAKNLGAKWDSVLHLWYIPHYLTESLKHELWKEFGVNKVYDRVIFLDNTEFKNNTDIKQNGGKWEPILKSWYIPIICASTKREYLLNKYNTQLNNENWYTYIGIDKEDAFKITIFKNQIDKKYSFIDEYKEEYITDEENNTTEDYKEEEPETSDEEEDRTEEETKTSDEEDTTEDENEEEEYYYEDETNNDNDYETTDEEEKHE